MRISRDGWGIELARVTARRGTCCRRQVGCVLVDRDGHVLATGYNGVAAGQPHCNDVERVVPHSSKKYLEQGEFVRFPNACPGQPALSGTALDTCQAIHAEQNALLQCKDVREIHTVYVTCSPCVTCVKLLMNTGCERIVFAEPYAHDEAARLLWNRYGPPVNSKEWVHYQGEEP